MGKLVYIYYIYTCMRTIYTILCVYMRLFRSRNSIYSAVLNLSTGCFAVYAKRISDWNLFSYFHWWKQTVFVLVSGVFRYLEFVFAGRLHFGVAGSCFSLVLTYWM